MFRDYSDMNQHPQMPPNQRNGPQFFNPSGGSRMASTPSVVTAPRIQPAVFSSSGNVTYGVGHGEQVMAWRDEDMHQQMSHQMNPMMQSQPNLMETPFVKQEVWRNEMNSMEMGGWSNEHQSPGPQFSQMHPEMGHNPMQMQQHPTGQFDRNISMEEAVQVQMDMIKTLEKQQRKGEHDKREWGSWTKLESSQEPVQDRDLRVFLPVDKDERMDSDHRPARQFVQKRVWNGPAPGERPTSSRERHGERERSRSPDRNKDKDARRRGSRWNDSDKAKEDEKDEKDSEQRKSQDKDSRKEIKPEKEADNKSGEASSSELKTAESASTSEKQSEQPEPEPERAPPVKTSESAPSSLSTLKSDSAHREDAPKDSDLRELANDDQPAQRTTQTDEERSIGPAGTESEQLEMTDDTGPEQEQRSAEPAPSNKPKKDFQLVVLKEAAFEDVHLFHLKPKPWKQRKFRRFGAEEGEQTEGNQEEDREGEGKDQTEWKRHRREKNERWSDVYETMVQERKKAAQLATSSTIPPAPVSQIPMNRSSLLPAPGHAPMGVPSGMGMGQVPPAMVPMHLQQTTPGYGPSQQLAGPAEYPQQIPYHQLAYPSPGMPRPSMHPQMTQSMPHQSVMPSSSMHMQQAGMPMQPYPRAQYPEGYSQSSTQSPAKTRVRNGPVLQSQTGGPHTSPPSHEDEERSLSSAGPHKSKTKRVPTIEEYIEYKRIFGNDAKIDPKSFVEELSDNEEWGEVLDIVSAGGSGSATKEQQFSEGSVSPHSYDALYHSNMFQQSSTPQSGPRRQPLVQAAPPRMGIGRGSYSARPSAGYDQRRQMQMQIDSNMQQQMSQSYLQPDHDMPSTSGARMPMMSSYGAYPQMSQQQQQQPMPSQANRPVDSASARGYFSYSGPPPSAQQATMSMASRSGKSLLGNPYNPIEAGQQQQQQQSQAQMQQPPASSSSQQTTPSQSTPQAPYKGSFPGYANQNHRYF